MNTIRSMLAATAFSALMIGAMAVALMSAPAPAIAQQQIVAPRTVTLYGPTAVTTGTTYSSAPLTVEGQDMARTTNYTTIDLFAATGANSSGTLTVTLQFSPDETIWADATNVAYTFNTTGTLATNTVTQRIVLSGASVAGLVRTTLAGEFVRVKVDAAGTITPTVKATIR